jgi:hypothetical protein
MHMLKRAGAGRLSNAAYNRRSARRIGAVVLAARTMPLMNTCRTKRRGDPNAQPALSTAANFTR